MSSDRKFVDYLCEQMSGAGQVTSRAMFGEFAIYCDGKVVALVCDDQLFVKPTEGGRALLGNPEEAPPYPGAKNQFLIGEGIDDRGWLTRLIETTARELPAPKPKPVKGAKKPAARKR